MMPQLSETVFALGGTFIYQLLHLGAGIGGTLFGFILTRLEFVALYPASAVTGLSANIFIGWWLTSANPRISSRHWPLLKPAPREIAP